MARVKTVQRLRSLPVYCTLILVLFAGTAAEADCVQDALANVDREILAMASGAVYRVFNANGVELVFWLPLAGVTICDQVSISGELYYAVSNQDANQTVFAVRER